MVLMMALAEFIAVLPEAQRQPHLEIITSTIGDMVPQMCALQAEHARLSRFDA
jgi:rhamnogalacturonyl hydrolase YesR